MKQPYICFELKRWVKEKTVNSILLFLFFPFVIYSNVFLSFSIQENTLLVFDKFIGFSLHLPEHLLRNTLLFDFYIFSMFISERKKYEMKWNIHFFYMKRVSFCEHPTCAQNFNNKKIALKASGRMKYGKEW